MIPSIATSLILAGSFAAAQLAPPADLVGTWSSKSNKTLTGPGFYDPVNERFIEPDHTGISYSFTADGFYEEAYYRALANPAHPECPKGIMQWQHGSFTFHPNGSLTLVPIAVDGRQLFSDPCTYKNAVYTRYNTSEMFERFEVFEDKYHNIPRLNLYQHDGSPLQPLYLAMSPPQMLPTTTLNPLTTPTASSKVKRGEMPHQVLAKRTPDMKKADAFWYLGWIMALGGGTLYFLF